MSINFSIQFSLGATPFSSPYASPVGKPNERPSLTRNLSTIWQPNQNVLYHKFSPYPIQDPKGPSKQDPFIFIYPGGPRQITADQTQDIDILRVSSFMGSPRGNQFLTNQKFMQAKNVFEETRTYNETSPIAAAAKKEWGCSSKSKY